MSKKISNSRLSYQKILKICVEPSLEKFLEKFRNLMKNQFDQFYVIERNFQFDHQIELKFYEGS
jgi:hypothetical protein